MILHRLASEHMLVSERTIRRWLAEDIERGLAGRASHLAYHTRRPRDAA